MANNQNSQISYTPATIDPTISGYAARDPWFALGLMAGRYLANNYEQRGIDKLTKSVTDSNGNLVDPSNVIADVATQGAGNNAPQQANTNQNVAPALSQAASQSMPKADIPGAPKQIPQIFAVNQNPAMQSTNPYSLGNNPLTGQPEYSSIRAQVMQKAIDDANAPQTAPAPQGDTSYRDSIMEKARAILNDDSNKWVQSANRGDRDMALYKAGAIGNGVDDKTANPYAIGNYNDPSLNYANMRKYQQELGQTVGIPQMDANGNVTMQMNQPVNLNNMTAPQIYQPTQSMFSQYVPNPSAITTLAQAKNLWGNMETPQQSAVLDAVQQAKAVNPTQAGQNNGGPVQSEDSANQPAPQDNQHSTVRSQPAQPQPAQSQPAQAQPTQNQPIQNPFPQAKSPAQQLAQNIILSRNQQAAEQAAPPLRPFNAQEWAASVWREGVKQGRPTSQIQAVINNLMPQAQAAEQGYKDSATSYYMNNIFNPDNPLIPTASNYAIVMPKLMSNISALSQVNPEAAQRVLSILPGAKDAWNKDVADQTLDKREAYATKSAAEQYGRDLNKMKYGADLQIGTFKAENDYKSQQAQAEKAQRYNALSQLYGPETAAAIVYGGINPFSSSKSKGSGAGNGKQQNDTVNGFVLSNAQQARANELDANLTRYTNNVLNYMGSTDKSDIENFGNSIAALQDYYDNLDDKDKAVIPQEVKDQIEDIMYAANARREYLAGNYEQASKYASALPDGAKKRYGISFK